MIILTIVRHGESTGKFPIPAGYWQIGDLSMRRKRSMSADESLHQKTTSRLSGQAHPMLPCQAMVSQCGIMVGHTRKARLTAADRISVRHDRDERELQTCRSRVMQQPS